MSANHRGSLTHLRFLAMLLTRSFRKFVGFNISFRCDLGQLGLGRKDVLHTTVSAYLDNLGGPTWIFIQGYQGQGLVFKLFVSFSIVILCTAISSECSRGLAMTKHALSSSH